MSIYMWSLGDEGGMWAHKATKWTPQGEHEPDHPPETPDAPRTRRSPLRQDSVLARVPFFVHEDILLP